MSAEISDPKTNPEANTEKPTISGPSAAEESYKQDMFKYKERMKLAEVGLAAAQAEKAALERVQLEQNEEWKTLYEKEKTERENAVVELHSKSKQFIDSSKINAVVQGLGGFKKDDYSKFIDPSNIEVTESGVFDTESLNKEVERIRQTFPELLKASSSPALPNGAPSSVTAPEPKILANMSRADLMAQFTKSRKQPL